MMRNVSDCFGLSWVFATKRQIEHACDGVIQLECVKHVLCIQKLNYCVHYLTTACDFLMRINTTNNLIMFTLKSQHHPSQKFEHTFSFNGFYLC